MAIDANTHMIDDRGTQMVVLWDVGPAKPVQPKRPDAPQGKPGEPNFELAKVEFEDTLNEYKTALEQYRLNVKTHQAWHRRWGGPYEMFNVWSVDADDHMARDPERYFISSRTRGHSSRPNHGLPEGLKPGRGHFENLQRIEQGESDLAALKQSDPVFGKVELRA